MHASYTVYSFSLVAVCNVTYPLISGDRFRLLDSSFSASSYLDSSHTASDARLLQTASRGWCSGELLSIEPQWLEIAFPVGVVISAISTAGTTNAYTVLYSVDSMDTLETYREPGSATVKVMALCVSIGSMYSLVTSSINFITCSRSSMCLRWTLQMAPLMQPSMSQLCSRD